MTKSFSGLRPPVGRHPISVDSYCLKWLFLSSFGLSNSPMTKTSNRNVTTAGLSSGVLYSLLFILGRNRNNSHPDQPFVGSQRMSRARLAEISHPCNKRRHEPRVGHVLIVCRIRSSPTADDPTNTAEVRREPTDRVIPACSG